MLRISETAELAERRADQRPYAPRVRPARLLVVHGHDPRLAALGPLLRDLGYDASTLPAAEDARQHCDSGGPPDILVTARNGGSPMRGSVFAHECLARYPALQALYVTWLPRTAAGPLGPRERLLAAPFSAACLTAAITALVARRS
jgi:hypothetical protein